MNLGIFPRAAASALLLLSVTGATQAEQIISGEVDVECTLDEVMACIHGGECRRGSAASFDFPPTMIVDVERKLIRALDEKGRISASAVKSREVTEKSAILQGIEDHRGWTIGIDRMDGTLSMSSTGPDVQFMIMGKCAEK